jgi:hypothetical protein
MNIIGISCQSGQSSECLGRDLVGTNGQKKRGTGPTDKMRQLFEAASRLPRSQQQKIAAVLEAFIAHNAVR